MTVKIEELTQEDILLEVLEGLQKPQKELPAKLFYDEKGSQLFDQICELDEYYPTRTETKILHENIEEIGETLGKGTLLLELGSGSSIKIRLLLDFIPGLAGYVPIDISTDHLIQSVETLKVDYPNVSIFPLAADYTKDFKLPKIENPFTHKAVFFPGSTIGNFKPGEAREFLGRIAKIIGLNGGMIIGVDLKKDIRILEDAYNDKKEVTAAFNLNILNRINSDTGSNFDLSKYRHKAIYNEDEGRIEMHLISLEDQQVKINEETIEFDEGEHIITEYSYKYKPEEFAKLVEGIFEVRKVWTDSKNLFSVQYLRVI